MSVSLVVEESCHLDVRPVEFGTMPAAQPSAQANSSMILACTPDASYVVTLDEGRNGARRMADASGSRFIAYDLFSDPAFTRRWGSTPASGVSGMAPAHGRVELGLYARVSGAEAKAGSYGDTVTVTVAF